MGRALFLGCVAGLVTATGQEVSGYGWSELQKSQPRAISTSDYVTKTKIGCGHCV